MPVPKVFAVYRKRSPKRIRTKKLTHRPTSNDPLFLSWLSSNISPWVATCCILNASHYSETSSTDLYASYQRWKTDRGEPVLGKSGGWGKYMTNRFSKHRNDGIIYENITLLSITEGI